MKTHGALLLAMLAMLALAVVAPLAHAGKPPSFALWTAKWSAHSDQVVRTAVAPCQKAFPTDDARLGACFIKVELAATRHAAGEWEKDVANIAVGQTPTCKKAIHAYWLASRKNQAAAIIFYTTHAHATMTDIADEIKAEPYPTLQSLTKSAKSHAIRVCG
jgi:hypothetical protein